MDSVYVEADYDFNLLTEKGAHPYEYMNSLSKFNDKDLPSTQGFCSKLSEEKPVRTIMTERWRHSITFIWKIWETTTICI